MFWDRVAPLYDFFEKHSIAACTTEQASPSLSWLASKMRFLNAPAEPVQSVFSLRQSARGWSLLTFLRECSNKRGRKLAKYRNVTIERADITKLHYADDSFDVVIAGNVIHLLPDPGAAMRELERVVRPGGTIVVPTYVKRRPSKQGIIPKILARLGVDFKEQFDVDSYRAFFEKLGYRNVTYTVIDGRIPCVIASFTCNNDDQ